MSASREVRPQSKQITWQFGSPSLIQQQEQGLAGAPKTIPLKGMTKAEKKAHKQRIKEEARANEAQGEGDRWWCGISRVEVLGSPH